MRWPSVLDRAPKQRPRPRVKIELSGSLPAWTVRGLAASAIIVLATPVLGGWVIPLVAALLVMVIPHQGTVAGLALLAGVWLVAEPPSLVLCATLTLLLHVVLVTVRLTAPVGVTARIETRLLGRVLAAFVVIQLIAQAMVGLAFTAMEQLPPLPWIGVLTIAALAVAILAAVRWVARHTQ